LETPPRHLRRAWAWLAAGALLVLAAPTVGDARRPSDVDRLQAESKQISSQRHAAVLEVYALDSRLAAARARLGSIELRIAEIRRQRGDVATQLRVARRGAVAEQQHLARRIHQLYERSEVDPVAILLGASSLDEALATIDDLDRVAADDRRVLQELRDARSKLTALEGALARQEGQLISLRDQAASTARALALARDARSRYLTQLARRQELTQKRISSIERQSQVAQRRSERLARPAREQVEAPTAVQQPGTEADGAEPSALPGSERTLTVVATGYSIHGTTATGLPTGWGIAAVDPSVIPLGTRLTIPGYGEAIAADVGSAVQGATIDLWFPTVAQALAWGRQTVTIELH